MPESALKVHFSSRRNSWETPQSFFDKLHEEFHFELYVPLLKTLNVKNTIVRQRMSKTGMEGALLKVKF